MVLLILFLNVINVCDFINLIQNVRDTILVILDKNGLFMFLECQKTVLFHEKLLNLYFTILAQQNLTNETVRYLSITEDSEKKGL